MPWQGVTVSEQRQNFIRDWLTGYYSVSELGERFSITRKTAHKWIARFRAEGEAGLAEQSRRPINSPSQTDERIVNAILEQKAKHPNWGARKLLDVLHRRHPRWDLPSEITAHRWLERNGLVHKRRRYRRLHPGCPKTRASEPNQIWAADYKGHFRMGNGRYCFPLTISDLGTRYLLGCDGHDAISQDLTMLYFQTVFARYGLPERIRTDNGVPFATQAIARLSQLSVWWIKLGIYPELIEPGKPQQNGIHERMHRTLKAETTRPPERTLEQQQQRFEAFMHEYNDERPHEAIDMKRPAELYRRSSRELPAHIEAYDYPGNYVVRRVSRDGTARLVGNQFFVTTALRGEDIGFEEVDEGIYDVYFCFYHIGRYYEEVNRVRGVISEVAARLTKADAAERL